MDDAYNIYERMEKNNILLSFKGDITSELLTSILQIMENQMENINEEPKTKKKVYNVLVECLQNLYHHMDDSSKLDGDKNRNAIFMIAKSDSAYNIITGNYIFNENVEALKTRLDVVIDIARKTGEKLQYNFLEIDNKVSFFTLDIKITQTQLI